MRFSTGCSVALSLSLVAAAFPGSLKFGKRTVTDIQAGIAAISTQVTALNASVNRFSIIGGTFLDAVNTHNGVGILERTINGATTDVKNTGPVSETDGNAVLQSVRTLQPQFIAALEAVIAKKPAFDRLTLPALFGPMPDVKGIIRGDLNSLHVAATGFGNSLVDVAPVDLKNSGRTIQADLDAEFAKALATYAA